MTEQTFESNCLVGNWAPRIAATLWVAVALGGSGCGSALSTRCDNPAWTPPTTVLQRAVPLSGKSSAPLLIYPLGHDGRPCNPYGLNDVQSHVVQGYTDVYVICPGWHDEWTSAVAWIETFTAGYERSRTWATGEPRPQAVYKPLYIGVVWPTVALNRAFPTFSSDSRRPQLRPDIDLSALKYVLDTQVEDAVVERIVVALRTRGHDMQANKLALLLARDVDLTPPELIDFAACLLPLYGPQSEPSAPGLRYATTAGRPENERAAVPKTFGLFRSSVVTPPISAGELLDVWKDALRTATGGLAAQTQPGGVPPAALQAYGLSVPRLLRWALRATDLRVLNDTAYHAGLRGVGNLLATVIEAGNARVHLVGHSFGAEVVLAAVATYAGSRQITAPAQSTQPSTELTSRPAAIGRRPVDSVLLLSPLVNHWALGGAPNIGPDVPTLLQSRATPGTYRAAVGNARSVAVLFSSRDWFASVYAPLALRRPSFEGMASPDSWSGRGEGYATMGGVGPNGVEAGGREPVYRETLIAPGAAADGPLRYNFPTSGATVIAIDGSASIATHGDANDRTIWWLFANQVGMPK